MPLPNFIIIGAHKSGTSSLYDYLSQHPQVYMSPIKETRFFAYDENNEWHRKKVPSIFPVTTMDAYRQLFDAVSSEIAVGEATPEYLNSQLAAHRIKDTLPDVKLIAILRNPVDRAYSHYQMHIREGYLRGSVPPESFNIDDRWIQGSFYFEKILYYYNLFGSDKVKVVLFEDMRANANAVLQDIYRYLGVDDRFRPSVSIKNVGGLPKNRLLDKVITNRSMRSLLTPFIPEKIKATISKMHASNMKKAPPLSNQMRSQLTELYREDICQLQGLLKRDLSSWLPIEKAR